MSVTTRTGARNLIAEIDVTKPIKLTLKTSTDPFRVKIATIIQKQLKDVGVDLKIKSLDWGTFFRDIQAGNFRVLVKKSTNCLVRNIC
jgi:peptide/nickel transport system substrate-binding protein